MENTIKILQNIENLWKKYFEAKEIPLRKVMKNILAEIITSIESLDDDVRNKYLITLMEKYYEEGIQYPIQEPRLWKHCLAFLKGKFEEKDVKYLIWLYKSYTNEGVYEIVKMHPSDLLLLALNEDLQNKEIASLLYIEYLNTIDYGMHELPEYLVIDENVLVDLINKSLKLESAYPNTEGLTNRYGNNLQFYIKLLKEWKTSGNIVKRITNTYPFGK
jgi:hypothetical protein